MFKVGDIVKAFGVEGTVTHDCRDGDLIRVKFKCGGQVHYDYFTPDGKVGSWAHEPSLAIVSRPKVKRTITRKRWINVYKNDRYKKDALHVSKENAENSSFDDRLACVEVSYSFETDDDTIVE